MLREMVGRLGVPSRFRKMTRETADDIYRPVTGDGRVAEAFRVGVQSDPSGAAQGSYEGSVTTAREMLSTVRIE